MSARSYADFRRGAVAGTALAAALFALWTVRLPGPRDRLEALLKLAGPEKWAHAERVRSSDPPGGRLETWRFTASGAEAQAYLYLPAGQDAGGLHPAVIVLHGHATDPRELVGLAPEVFMGPVARTLADKGFIVLVPWIRFSSSDLKAETRSALRLLAEGRTLMGERVSDVLRYAAFLRGRPDVGGRRVGVLGWSMGGVLALFAGALDREVGAVYVSGGFGSLERLFAGELQSPDNYVPGILEYGGLERVARLIPPRPLFIEAARRDTNWDIGDVTRRAEELKRVYARTGASERLRVETYPGGHRFDGRDAAPWLTRWLSASGVESFNSGTVF